MSKKQITLELNITPTVADAQIKASAEKIKDALSRVKLDKSNLNVFKELSEWLDVIDAKVSELKKIDAIQFDKLYGGASGDKLNKALRSAIEPYLSVPENIGKALAEASQHLDNMRSKIGSTTKEDLQELKASANAIREIYKSIGKEVPAELNFSKKQKVTEESLAALDNALKNLSITWDEVIQKTREFDSSTGGKASNAVKKISNDIAQGNSELQEQIDQLESEKKRYQEVIDAINGKNIKIKTTKKDDVAQVKELVEQFLQAKEAVRQYEIAKNTSGNSYKYALAEEYRLAVLLKNTMDDVSARGSNDAVSYIMEQATTSYDQAEKIIDKFGKLNSGFKQSILNSYKQSIVEIDAEIAQLHKPTDIPQKTIMSYEQLSAAIREYIKLQQEMDNAKSDAEFDALDKKIEKVSNSLTHASAAAENVLALLRDGEISEGDAISKIANDIGITIPSAAQNAEKTITSAFGEIINKADQLNESIKKVCYSASEIEVSTRNGLTNGRESMNLFSLDGSVSTAYGTDYQVDTDSLVQQIVANLNKNIIMSLHNHANGDMAFSPADINSFARLYYGQGAKINGIIANGIVQTIDFSSISQEVAINIAKDYQDGIRRLFEAGNISQYVSMTDEGIVPTDMLKQIQSESIAKYQEIISGLQEAMTVVLRQSFEKNGAEFTWQAFSVDNIEELTTYLTNIQQSANTTLEPIEKLRNLVATLRPDVNLNEFTEVFEKFKNGAIDGTQALKQILDFKTGTSGVANQDQIAQLEKEKTLMQEIEGLKAKLNSIPINPVDMSELETAQQRVKELEAEVNRVQFGLNSWRDTAYDLQLSLDKSVPISELENMTPNDVVDSYRDKIASLQSIINQLNDELAMVKTRLTEVQFVSNDLSNTGDASFNNTEKKIQSYEELCKVVERYNELILQGQTVGKKFTDADNKEIEALMSRFAATKDVLSDPDKYLDFTMSMDRMRGFLGEYSTDKLAQYLGIEIPQTATKASVSIDNLKEKAENLGAQLKQLQATQVNVDNMSYEAQNLENLRIKLEEVQAAIDAKTHAFQSEASIVGGVVEQEIAELTKLENYLNTLKSLMSSIFNGETSTISVPSMPTQTSSHGYASETTLGQTNTILGEIRSSVDAIGKNVPKTIAPTQEANVRIADTRQYEQIRDVTLNAIGDRGTESKITGMKALADGLVQVNGYIKTAEGNYENFVVKVNAANEAIGLAFSENQKLTQQMQAQAAAQKTFSNNLNLVSDEFVAYKNSINQSDQITAKFSSQIQQMENRLATISNSSELDIWKADWDKLTASIAAAKREQEKLAAEAAKNAYNANQVKNISNKYIQLSGVASSDEFAGSASVQAAMANMEAAYNRLIAKQKEFGNTAPTESQKRQFAQLTDQYNQAYKALDNIIKSSRKLAEKSVGSPYEIIGGTNMGDKGVRMQELQNAVNLFSNGTAQIKGFNTECTQLTYTIKNADGTFTEMNAVLDQTGTKIYNVAGQTKKATSLFGEALQAIKNKTKQLLTYAISMGGIYRVFRVMRQGLTYIKEIDAALTELKKVTDETDATYQKFLNTAAKTGAEIGATVSDFVNAVADFARLGYSISEATELAKAASVYKNVGDGIDNVQQATESIISTMKANICLLYIEICTIEHI